MTRELKNKVRKIAKKRFRIPKNVWINVYEVGEKKYLISYLTNSEDRKEWKEVLVVD